MPGLCTFDECIGFPVHAYRASSTHTKNTRRVDNGEGIQNPPNCSRAFEPVNISQVATIPMVYQHSSWLRRKKDP